LIELAGGWSFASKLPDDMRRTPHPKTKWVTLAFYFAWIVLGQPGLLLKEGDVFVFEFVGLLDLGEASGPERSLFTFNVQETTLDPGDRLRYETFENIPAGDLICSGQLDGPPGPSLSEWLCNWNSGWQDLQGCVRFTMEAGSLVLGSIRVAVVQSGPPARYFESVVELTQPAPPNLTIKREGHAVILAWETAATNYVLQYAEGLSATNTWFNVAGTPIRTNGLSIVAEQMGERPRWFRLASSSDKLFVPSRSHQSVPGKSNLAASGGLIVRADHLQSLPAAASR
jgi:hypothetical protein